MHCLEGGRVVLGHCIYLVFPTVIDRVGGEILSGIQQVGTYVMLSKLSTGTQWTQFFCN